MPLKKYFSLLLIGVILSATLDAAQITGIVSLSDKSSHRRLTQRYRGSGDVTMDKAPKAVAVIYLLSSDGGAIPVNPPDEPMVMTQKGLQFIPSVLPIMIGSKVQFPNEDNTYHNVFSYSDTKRFDLGRFRKGEDPPLVTFDKAGVVKVFCEIHGHMRANILILETPYFTASSERGEYVLSGVPAGDYELHIWRPGQEEIVRPITLSESDEKVMNFNSASKRMKD